jgi:glycosyltransferase involved in cell wall biosynthesis
MQFEHHDSASARPPTLAPRWRTLGCGDDPQAVGAVERAAAFVISADYERRTGGWVYNARLVAELRRRGWDIRDVVAPAGFPAPDSAAAAATTALLAALPDRTLVLSDQLVTNVLPDLMVAEAARLRLVPIVHHPLELERGRSVAAPEVVAQRERRALSAARRIITTSSATADILTADYGVASERLVVARPGIDRLQPAGGSAGGPPLLLAIGAVVPRKDHGTLIAAMAGLRDRPWRLVIVGNTTRAADHVATLRHQIAAAGLVDRIDLAGEIDDSELAQLWSAAELFVSSSAHEGFGMAVGEAVARALPVVTTAAGAVAGWLDRRAAIVVEVGDADALRAAIGRLLDDRGHREQLRSAAAQARADLPSWADAGSIVDGALSRLA